MSGVVAVSPGPWRLADGRRLSLDEPVVMGVLNLTPDSFSDGGELGSVDDALARAHDLVEAGAAILDVGGESTRPGAREVPQDEELARVLPFVREASRAFPVPISVDTRKAAVAEAALEAGAALVNDVSGLAFDPEMAEVVARHGAGLVLMHMRGTPDDMSERAVYTDLLAEVRGELGRALGRAEAAGIDPRAVVVDPGLGFAKTAEQSLTLLARLDELLELGRPVLLGPGRKSFLGYVTGLPPRERVAATVAACVLGWTRGARIFRVHDVAPVAQALAVAAAVDRHAPEAGT